MQDIISRFPHYYLDTLGHITHDVISITQNHKPVQLVKKNFGPADTCIWNDREGRLIFKQVIKNGGLEFIRPDGRKWSLRPDRTGGGSYVWIFMAQVPVARVRVQDDGEKGNTRLFIDYYDHKKLIGTWQDEFFYDRFTGYRTGK